MASRKPTADDDGGLDSLLDTMTNVVGILVLVLIVTQLGVADVVTRITQRYDVTEEKLEDLSQQVRTKENELDELTQILVNPLDIDPEKQRQELERKRELLERRKKLLAEKKQQQNEFAIKLEEDRQQAEQNRQMIEQSEQQREQLDAKLTVTLEQKAKLEALLAETKKVAPPADVQVSIPNPRPPPQGAKRIDLVCANERIYPVARELFQKRAEQRAKQIAARLGKDPVSGIDPERFTAVWETLQDQDEFFEVEYYVAGKRYPRLRFVPKEERGATIRSLTNPTSKIRRYLSGVNPAQSYARFYVLPDSYETYLLARRQFTKSGMLAGWAPQSEGWNFITGVPGGIELGPPRDDPPRPPSKPQNLID